MRTRDPSLTLDCPCRKVALHNRPEAPKHLPMKFLYWAVVAVFVSPVGAGEDFVSLFNGKDLSGWDGDPKLWSVRDGIVTGVCAGPEAFPDNTFLIWRGGVLTDFELRVVMRVKGDNNSGIQYRSRPAPGAGPWAISGYQCDVHPAVEHTGMTYEEKGRGIFGLNGKSVILDPSGTRWLTAEQEPVRVNVSDWNEYTVIARGNRLIHKVNGQVSSELIDCDEKGRALEGLLAIQLHRGNANTVEIRELQLKVIREKAEPIPFDPAKLPSGARRIERPGTKNPQGIGPASR